MASAHRRRDPETPAKPGLSRAEFGRQVREALSHLHDPIYLQTHPMAPIPSAEPGPRPPDLGRSLRQSLLAAIEALRPDPGVSASSPALRRHQLLTLRYLEALDIAQVQERLGIARTQYYVEHQRALEAVVSLLWERWGLAGRAETSVDVEATGGHASTGQDRTERTVGELRHNLPLQLTSFVGRGREAAEVRDLLASARHLTLVGAGGCGKTRLALEVARGLLADHPAGYPDGVWLVDLASLADPSLVPQTVASVLGVRERLGQPLVDAVVDHLASRRLLLVLDNCEHLVEACAHLVERLLRACPDLRVLATSRESLGVPGEVTWRVPSLEVPDALRSWSLEELGRFESVQLLVERVRLARRDFAVTSENASPVCRICRRLDGMPLAIELAAARIGGLTVEEVAARLDDRFRLLTGGSRTASRRQRTLKATIDWSHDLLSESERVLFRRLGVFVGGFSLEAAEEICSGGEVERQEVVDHLLRLVDRSLVVVDAQQHPARYRLLETIRQYAQERLFEAGETTAVRDRHLEWHLALAERSAPELLGREQRAWLERLEREHDNIRAALDWSLAREGDVDSALRLAAALGNFWEHGGYYTERRERLGLVLARPGGDPAARVATLGYAALAESKAGHWQKAREWHEQALALARQAGDRRLIRRTLSLLSFIAFDLGEWAAARALQEEALALARKTGDRWSIAVTLMHLTMTLYLQGDLAAARPLAEELIVVSRPLGDRSIAAFALTVVGHVLLAEGLPRRARALAEEGLAMAREADQTHRIAMGLRLLGDVARAEGDFPAAEIHYRGAVKAFQQWTEKGDWLRTTSFLVSLAGIWVALGRARQAVRLYGAVHGWLESIGAPVPWMPPRDYGLDEVAAREALGEEAFAQAWAEGQALTLEQAVEYALLETA